MDLDRVNKWLTFGANLGVLLGIVFLAMELQQNNDLLEAELSMNYTSLATSSGELIAQNPQLAAAAVKNPSERTPGEVMQLNQLMLSIYRKFEWVYQHIPYDQLPLQSWKNTFSGTTSLEIWKSRSNEFSPQFVEFVNSELIPQ